MKQFGQYLMLFFTIIAPFDSYCIMSNISVDPPLCQALMSKSKDLLADIWYTVNSFNFVGTNFRGLGKKGISWDS